MTSANYSFQCLCGTQMGTSTANRDKIAYSAHSGHGGRRGMAADNGEVGASCFRDKVKTGKRISNDST
jgi:hypothetical protein